MPLTKFSPNLSLPDYLEEVLAPFSWSGVLSREFRDCVLLCLIATNRQEATASLVSSVRLVCFLNKQWVDELTSALTRFAVEGFKK